MKILIDTNVLLDYLSGREPFATDSTEVIRLCSTEQFDGYVAVHSILNLFFILRKSIPDANQRREKLTELSELFKLVSIDSDMIRHSLKNNDFKDFEDCVQAECAVKAGADCIITRNIKDFEKSPVKAISPEDFLKGV
ncbi:MAG: PIN domain-containing protein [Oscillospiraceae bacterium]|nr:PIN domain-containing protein [Oscillospiraceae bacterium]